MSLGPKVHRKEDAGACQRPPPIVQSSAARSFPLFLSLTTRERETRLRPCKVPRFLFSLCPTPLPRSGLTRTHEMEEELLSVCVEDVCRSYARACYRTDRAQIQEDGGGGGGLTTHESAEATRGKVTNYVVLLRFGSPLSHSPSTFYLHFTLTAPACSTDANVMSPPRRSSSSYVAP